MAPTPPAREPVSYWRHVRPILQEHCFGCHQPAKPSGGYVMTRFDRFLAGGESGSPAIVPGKIDQSNLWEQIHPEDGKPSMPKDQPPLVDASRETLRRWIIEGARDDSPLSTEPTFDSEHPPSYASPPVVTSLDFSPDGQWLAVSGNHEVLLHRADGSGIGKRLVGISERIESAVFSPDGKKLAVTGGLPGRMGEVQIWDVAGATLDLSLTVGYDTCYGASWSPDGRLVAFGCPDNSVRVIEAATGRQVLYNGAHSDWVLDTVFSVHSDHVITVSRDMSMKLIEVATQRFVDNITSITPGALKGGLNAVDRHPTADQLVVGGSDGVPRIYRMYREKARQIGDDFNLIRAFEPMPGRVFAVSYSGDGKRVAAGSSLAGKGMLRLYDAEDGKTLLSVTIDSGGVYAVAFDASGQLLAAGGFDGQVRLLDTTSGQVVRTFSAAPLTAPQ